MKYTKQITTLLILLFVIGGVYAVTPTLSKTANQKNVDEWVNFTYSSLTPRERIAQLFMPVIDLEKNDAKVLIEKYVKEQKVGGLIYSQSSIANYAKSVNYAQSISSTPLMIAIDGEWGVGMRLSDAISFPKNLILGAIQDDKLLYEYGKEVGRQCRELGIQINFAPVLDVNTNPLNPVIGYRSLGDIPENVSRKGIAYSKGLEDSKVLSVAKHFPGHGATDVDSHKELPVVNKNIAELKLVDLFPFRQYVNSGLSGIMVGHIEVPVIEKEEKLPASMSYSIVTDLLQNKIGFRGLIFTDALGMSGAKVEGSSSVKALMAGNDVLLSPLNVKNGIDAIEQALKDGVVSEKSIEEKCKKVLRYKYILGCNKPKPVEIEGLEERINSSGSKALENRLWSNAITVFKNPQKILPITDLANNNILLIENNCKEFTRSLKLYADVKVISSDEINNQTLAPYNTIIIPLQNNSIHTQNLLKTLAESGKNVIAAFFGSPYSVSAFKNIFLNSNNVAAVMAFNDSKLAQNYAAQAIFGGIAVKGRLPVSIPGLCEGGAGFSYPAIRLGYSTPLEVGVDEKLITFIDSIANVGVKTNAFPGCQVLIAKDGKVICNKSFGYLDSSREIKVDENTLYDLASVSKATGTLPGIMKACDKNLLSIDAPIGNYILQLRGTEKGKTSVRDYLFHQTGMPPSLNMFDIMLDSNSYSAPLFKKSKDKTHIILVDGDTYADKNARLRTDILSTKETPEFNRQICKNLYGSKATYDTIMWNIYNCKLRHPKNYVYSCLNFCLLMNAEENVTKVPHDVFVEKNIFNPLGAYHTLYNPLSKFKTSQIAATEKDNLLRKQTLVGYVHDELADFSGGVQGNAGLFSNANDLAKLCQMWLNKGVYGGERLLSEKTVAIFTTDKSKISRRGLGFDKPDKTNDDNSPTCSEAPATAYGHLGFTGTCFWVDPTNDIIYIFLCNRVNPTRDNQAFSDLDIRPRIFEEVYKCLLK